MHVIETAVKPSGFAVRSNLEADYTQPAVFLNGRFATQPLTGVQRFCSEMAAELAATFEERLQIVAPRLAPGALPAARQIGRMRGHKWEQLELPAFTRRGYLVSLGNTAPIFRGRQLVVIHDAGVYETPEAYGWRFRLWYKAMQRRLIRNGSTIVTISESARRDLAKHLEVPEERILLVPEGTDHLDKITADERAMAELNLQPRRFVLAVGNLVAHKNLRALSVLAEMLPTMGAELVIAGNLKGNAYSTNGLNGLPQPARYIGRISDEALKALYNNAACYVLPSRYEGYGLPAAEAMRCGCPVVAADIPALRETCGDAALYAAPGAPQEFADKVAQILQDDGLRSTLITRGIGRAQHRTWRRAARHLAGIVEHDLNRLTVSGFGELGRESA